MAYRIDRGSLRPATKLADGRLRVDGRLTKHGVFVYRDSVGRERREYRPPDEVFHADALASFALAPLTDDHPPESVSAANARRHAIGTVGEIIRRDGDHVVASLMVFDATTIAKMEAGKVQLSCGYLADVVEEPGVSPEGERYDAVQRNIRGNHVALVDVARAGPEACVRMDAAFMVDGATATREDQMTLEEAKQKLADAEARAAAEKVRADGLQNRFDAFPPALKKKLAKGAEGDDDDDDEDDDEKKKAKAKKKDAAADRADARADALVVENDALKAKLAAAEQERKDAADQARADARARVALETVAAPILGAEFKLDGVADRVIREKVVEKLAGKPVPAGKSDEYVAARFDAEMERHAASRADLGDARTLVEGSRLDASATGDKGDAARARMMQRHRDAWKTPSAGSAGQNGA